MKKNLETTNGEVVPVLSISPVDEDHFLLRDILNRVPCSSDQHWTFAVDARTTLVSAFAALRNQHFEVVVCERDLQTGSWRDLLTQLDSLPDPPSLIVTSRLADERLWVEALNLGAYDVLAKPFDGTEVARVVCGASRAWGMARQRKRVDSKIAIAANAS